MKPGFLDKVIERIDRIDPHHLQAQFLRLAREKGLMEAVFQAIHEGVVVLNAEGRITFANKAAERLLGIPSEDFVGKPIARYLRDIDWRRILDLDAGEWSKMLSYEIEVTYPVARFLSFYVVPLAEGEDEEGGVLVMFRDITHDREEEANAVESERHNAIKLLAAGVAHEIGNPLNALNIHLQLIERELDTLHEEKRQPLHELLRVARQEVSRLDQIIAQFLQAVRPSHPRRVPAHVEEILRDTVALLRTDIENRRIEVRVDRAGPLPRIPVDPAQIKQAFFNIIKNAFQAMPDGGRLTIGLSHTDRFLLVAFRDTGGGIPKENIGRLFEPYASTKPDGTGLGLMIVQRIVQDHGGAIEVHSEPQSGTTVVILLPLVERQVRLLKSQSPPAEVATA